jgi:hypothetical protein
MSTFTRSYRNWKVIILLRTLLKNNDLMEYQNMDIQTFVSETLQQVITGIHSAQNTIGQGPTGAKINPRGITTLEKDPHGQRQPHDINTKLPIHQIEFDIAVTVSESTEGKTGGGLLIAGLVLGGQKAATSENLSVSRIRFSVPVVWPDPDTTKH